jgi:hypothetical protein
MECRDDLSPSYRELLDAASGVAAPQNGSPDPRPLVANLRFIAPPVVGAAGAAFAQALRHAIDGGGHVRRLGDELEVLLGNGDVRIEVARAAGYLTT